MGLTFLISAMHKQPQSVKLRLHGKNGVEGTKAHKT